MSLVESSVTSILEPSYFKSTITTPLASFPFTTLAFDFCPSSTFEINLWFHPSYESYYANIRIYGGHTLIEYGSEGPSLIDFVEALIKIIDREKDSKYWPNYNKLKQAKPKLQEIVDKFYNAI